MIDGALPRVSISRSGASVKAIATCARVRDAGDMFCEAATAAVRAA